MLAARDLHLSRGHTQILRGVSLAVAPGMVTALIGPNGAGKSTLLHLLSGALAPDAGEVSLDDLPLADLDRAALARRRAVLPQASVLAFPFRALEVVLMGRSAHAGHTTRARDLEIAAAALRETDATHLAERVYPTLSGGERQRVQLARVMAQIWPETNEGTNEPGPRYLLLDEPTNNLDLTHQHRLLGFARALADTGIGVLCVLHDPNLAALYADTIALLVEGRIQAAGLPDHVLTAEQIRRAFDLEVEVGRHPLHDCPHLVPLQAPSRVAASLTSD